MDHADVLGIGQQCPGVRRDELVVVDVDHADLRIDPVGDLVDVVLGRQAGADVDDLPDAGFDDVLDDPTDHLATRSGGVPQLRSDLQGGLGGGPIGLEVVLATQVVVEDARGAGDPRIDAGAHSSIIARSASLVAAGSSAWTASELIIVV